MRALLLCGLVVAGVVTLLFFSFLSQKRRLLRGRTPVDLDRTFQNYLKGEGIDYQTFREVFEAIGRFYSLDPRLLRLSDSFDDLAAFDSFRLSKGKEDMEDWLATKFSVDHPGERVRTVGELLRMLRRGR